MQNGDKKIRVRRRNANIAYACYLWIAIVLVVAMSLEWVFGNPQTPEELTKLQGVGMLIILPLSLAAIVAAIFGVESSLKLWSYWRREAGLLVLPILLLVLLCAFVLSESGALADTWLALLALLYAVTAAIFATHWFVTSHKRLH